MTALASYVDGLGLVDHHCHSTVWADLDVAGVSALLTESTWSDHRTADAPLGLALRRWCAPLLELPRHAPLADYVQRRTELGVAEVTKRFLAAAGLTDALVDTGFAADLLLDLPAFSAASGVPAHEVVRLETVAEGLAGSGVAAGDFVEAFRATLAETPAVAWKTIAAYRHGLHLDPARPSDAQVADAAARWLESGGRLSNAILLRFLLWSAVDTGRPLQVHCGFGDPDETLRRADPAFLQPFLHEVRTPVMLLHCYPYHRQAAYLAHAYPHVYFDIGLAVNHVGAAAGTVLAEALELAPFHKMLYSSDAFGLPELHYLGAVLFRRALTEVLDRWLARDDICAADARDVAARIAAGNAREVYRLGVTDDGPGPAPEPPAPPAATPAR